MSLSFVFHYNTVNRYYFLFQRLINKTFLHLPSRFDLSSSCHSLNLVPTLLVSAHLPTLSISVLQSVQMVQDIIPLVISPPAHLLIKTISHLIIMIKLLILSIPTLNQIKMIGFLPLLNPLESEPVLVLLQNLHSVVQPEVVSSLQKSNFSLSHTHTTTHTLISPCLSFRPR